MFISPELKPMLAALKRSGGKAYICGGSVRDYLLGLPTNGDDDVEIYGLTYDQMAEILKPFGTVDIVGAKYKVLRVRAFGRYFDFNLPRTEVSTGRGHSAFTVYQDPFMSLMDAARRRDFTINTMYIDVDTGDLFDGYNGRGDLRDGVLRHTSEQFVTDELRPFRGMRFSSTYGFRMLPETAELCTQIAEPYTVIQDMFVKEGENVILSRERLWEEWYKWSIGSYPHLGIKTLKECGYLRLFPELYEMDGCPQSPTYHPEGDVLTHTILALEQASHLAASRDMPDVRRSRYIFAVLLHDTGKPDTLEYKSGYPTNPGHANVSEQKTHSFLQSISKSGQHLPTVMGLEFEDYVADLVREHMFTTNPVSQKGVAKLLTRMQDGDMLTLALVMTADQAARPPLPPGPDEGVFDMLMYAAKVDAERGKPPKIITGDVLLAHNYKPGPEMGVLIAKAYEEQLAGGFTDIEGGMKFLEGG